MISLSQVKKAYKETGYTPCCGMYLGSNNNCCPISVLMIKDGYDPNANTLISAANKTFGEEFVTSFVAGFDDCVYNELYNKEAFDNGVKIRRGLHVKH